MPFDKGPENLVLRAAYAAKRSQLSRHLEQVSLEAGQPFWLPNQRIPHALFPVRGVVSLQVSTREDRLVEVALVGREGFAGVPLALGSDDARVAAVALTPCEALIMRPEIFRDYLRKAVFKRAVESYMTSYITMLAQISLCNRIHSIEDLWVGRLLLIQDRIQTDFVQVTQEFFARVLGVRRASLNQVARRLSRDGIIEYDRRGRITIRNRRRLEARACACYHAIKASFDQLRATIG